MTIEIIGRAAAAPGAPSIEDFKKILQDGICTVTSVPQERWELARFWHPVVGIQGKTYTYAAGVLQDIYGFDAGIFGLSQREAAQMDPQQRILLTLVWQALEDANIPPSALVDERVGVYVGASSLDSGNLAVEDPASGSPYFMTGNTLSIISNRISYIFGLRGPSMTIDTACSSSLVALNQAVKALEAGEIDTAIVGGVNLLAHPLSFVGFSQARMLSPEGLCRAYDADGHGYVRAEGGAAIVLRRSDRALAERDRSHGRIHAVEVNSSGRTNGIALPSREAQAALLQSIYDGKGIDVNRVAFIEGHGTGTRVGDPAEVWAIGTVIGKGRRAPVPIGSVKSNIGHTEPASGLFGLLKAVIALEENFLPATLHISHPNEEIDFEALNVRVNTSGIELLRAKAPRFAGVNSFGFGGTNVHVVVSDPDPVAPPEQSSRGEPVFVASAHTASALSRLLEDYRQALKDASPKQARQIVAAAGPNREALRHRFVVKAKDSAAVLEELDAHLAGRPTAGAQGEVPAQQIKTAFVFSGNGAQWAGMAVDAYRENSSFRQSFQSFSALFEYYLHEKLTDLLVSPDLSERIGDTRIAQPLLFAIQASLSDCLVALGVRPDLVFGHSVGEIAAAYAAKALNAAEAVAIVAKRSQHQHPLAGEGKMAAVVLGQEAAMAFAKSNGLDEVRIAAVNSANSVTISGPAEEIEAFKVAARKAHIVASVLDINYPFHHPIIDRAKSAFLSDLPDIQPEGGNVTFVSTVTGTTVDGRTLDADYWWRNVRDPVLFKAATEVAVESGCTLFIEISPRPILSNYVTETIKQLSVPSTAIPTFLRETPTAGNDPVARAFARAVAHGAIVQKSRATTVRNAFVSLPPLPIEPVQLKMPATTEEINIFGREGKSPYTLLGWRTDPNALSWQNHVDANLFPDLAEHVVDSKAIMPGAGFIEMAVTAAQQYLGSDEIEVQNLEILRPLELRSDRMLEVSTILSPETGDLEIRSRERLSSDDWTIHAVARCRRPIDLSSPSPMLPAKAADTHVVTARSAYETAERFGLHYGPSFQLLSRAHAFGQSAIEVDLKAGNAPKHPYLTYNLNPMSVDAAFHGLVALFDKISGDETGAPYIPVRFGSIRVSAFAPIAKAIIVVERFSATSIKVRFQLLGADGAEIAVLDDCRFRRTFLRRHHELASVAFHYESLPSDLHIVEGAMSPVADVQTLFKGQDAGGLDNATLLINAAIFRACHEIALRTASRSGIVSTASLAGDEDLRSFVTSCLYTLEDAGIAIPEGEHWRVPDSFTLPPLSEIVQEIYREDPSRIAEAVLVLDAYREALVRVGSGKSGDESETVTFASEATLEHVLAHSPLSRWRRALALEALQSALASSGQQPVLQITEIGSASIAFSQRVAAEAERRGAKLVVVEPRDNERRALELAFEESAHVSVVSADVLVEHPASNFILCAGDQSQQLLTQNSAVRQYAARSAEAGAVLIAVDWAPGIFSDFVFGQTKGWFTGRISAEFPVGQLGTAEQYAQLQRALGYSVESREIEGRHGKVVAAIGSGEAKGRHADASAFATPSLVLAIVENGEEPAIPGLIVDTVAANDPAAISAAISRLSDSPIRLLYVASHSGPETDSELTVKRMELLATLARETAQLLASSGKDATASATLVIQSPGGSPLAGANGNAANSGLWTFARVLQNEYDLLHVHLVDAEVDGKYSSRAIAAIYADQTQNREWVLDGATGELRQVRAVAGALSHAEAFDRNFNAATIRQRVSGRVDSLVWQSCDMPNPADDEVIVGVDAAGLNFRDVMWAMGVLPEEALEDGFAGATIGMEMAGRIKAVGRHVKDLKLGDKVMGIGPAAFSTHVKVKREGVTKLPDAMNTVAAATVPVAFLTAYYAMVELGRISEGETILIHGAAGGVGLAALQIAKLKGATVIATAGTEEKRALLTLLGADHVFDSRSLDFVNRVRDVTKGEGIDLVLNSLFAEAMERSLELVKPFGRFLELGKRDYYSDRKIGLRPFRRNISYFGIDADQLLVSAPDLTKRIFAEIGILFENGSLYPLPYRSFEFDEIGSAFRLMQNAGHIGKIVITPPVAGQDHVAVATTKAIRFDQEGLYLVAGGIGGFGLSAAEWLVSRGARRIALCSRRGEADLATKTALRHWKDLGVEADVYACDITDEASLKLLLDELRAQAALRGVIHAAMVLDDALMANLTPERNRPVIDVKVKGAQNLDQLTRPDDLDLFLLFSSATTMIGNPGQSNYVAANGYLEGLARRRRAEGLPALAVGFGAIADRGFLARNTEVNEILAKRIGKSAMRAREALDYVERYMSSDDGSIDAASVMIAEIDWGAVRLLPIAGTSLFEPLLRQSAKHQAVGDGDTIDLEALIKGKSEEEAQAALHEVVAAEIAAILRVAESEVGPEKILKDIGLDSLMAMELGMTFQRKTGFDIPLSGISDGTTVRDVVGRLRERVANRNPGSEDNKVDDMMAQLVQSHQGVEQKVAGL